MNKHEKLRQILIKNGNEEYGDAIIDDICELFGHPKTDQLNVKFFGLDDELAGLMDEMDDLTNKHNVIYKIEVQ